jgi:hypothetical protein
MALSAPIVKARHEVSRHHLGLAAEVQVLRLREPAASKTLEYAMV